MHDQGSREVSGRFASRRIADRLLERLPAAAEWLASMRPAAPSSRRCGALAAIAAVLAPLAAEPQSTYENVPKQVELIVDGGWLIASNVRFSRFDELKLSAQEVIVDSRVGNAVILIATNQRFIGYGVRSGWRTMDRNANEQVERLSAEDYAGLVVTSRRLLNFNGETGVWGTENRPVK